MVHLPPLPGTPIDDARPAVRESPGALAEGGADGCLVQTVDRVYHPGEDSDPARTAAMALVVNANSQATDESFQIGVQLIRNALKASLAGVLQWLGLASCSRHARPRSPPPTLRNNPVDAYERTRSLPRSARTSLFGRHAFIYPLVAISHSASGNGQMLAQGCVDLRERTRE
jgi:hypothetical protein